MKGGGGHLGEIDQGHVLDVGLGHAVVPDEASQALLQDGVLWVLRLVNCTHKCTSK